VLPLVILGVLAVATDPEPSARVGPQGVEGRFGMGFFAGSLGGESLSGLGLHVAVEKRLAGGDLQLGVEGTYLGLSDPEQQVDWRGRMSRAALLTRWRFIETEQAPVMGVWVDVGAGVERITWHRGGVLYRPELTVGASGTLGFARDPGRGRGRFGDFFQIRAVISRGPSCAGMRCPTELEMGVQGAVGFYFSE
jgi:hypothetical protein